MLVRSFTYPVSDEQALEDSIRVALGHEPEGVAGSGVFSANSNTYNGSPVCLRSASRTPAMGSDADGSPNRAVVRGASDTFDGGVSTRNHSGVWVPRRRHPPPGSTAGHAPTNLSFSHSITSNPSRSGHVVPVLDISQKHSTPPPHGEGPVPLESGDSYVFRFNIRVPEPPPPALFPSDSAVLSAVQGSPTSGNALGYRFANSNAPSVQPSGQFIPDPPGNRGEQQQRWEQPSFSHDDEVKRNVILCEPSADHREAEAEAGEDAYDTVGIPHSGLKLPSEGSSSSSSFLAIPPRQLSTAVNGETANGDHAGESREPAATPHTFLTTGGFHAQPILMDDVQRERIIVDCFNSLSSETRRLELLEAFYVAHMQPYEGRDSFTGDNWDDITRRGRVKRCFAVRFDRSRYCFYVTILRHEHRVFLFSFLLRCFCVFLFWVLMYCMLPSEGFSPGGLWFDVLSTVLFAGVVGALGARLAGLPALIGVIWAGILWNNVPYTGRLTRGITPDARQFFSSFGLTIGIIRAGLSLNVIRFRQKFKHYIAFSVMPMMAEAVVHGVCAKAIYGFPNYRWAFIEGFLVSSVAPSVVVPIIIAYQRKGYGVRDGPPMMMLCSIAVDTALCVWAIQFLLALEFETVPQTLLIVLAPVQVLVGLVGGAVMGLLVFTVTFYVLFMEAERLPGIRGGQLMTLRHTVHVRYLSIGFMVLACFTCLAVGKRFSCMGGSAVGVVTIAGTFNYLCVRGGTKDHLRVKADMAQTLATVWDYIAMPSLFALSGASVDVHELFARDTIGLAFGLVFIGIAARSLMAMAVPLITGLGLSWSEVLFCGIGWIGKGSVQGSMGAAAQLYAMRELAVATTVAARARAEERVAFGIKVKNTAMLSVLVACPLCSVFLTRFTSKLLKKGT